MGQQNKEPEKRKKIRGKIVDGALTVAVVAIAALAVLLVAAPFLGYHIDTVMSGSMAPAIGTGDLVLIGPVNPASIHAGQVIAFTSVHGTVSHRVVAVDQSPLRFETKGDANEGPDPNAVMPSQVVGQVLFNVPFVGFVSHFIRSPFGLILTIVLPGLLIAGIEAKTLLFGEGKKG